MHTGLTLTKPYTRPLQFGDRTVHPPAPPATAPLHIGDLNNLERFPLLTDRMTDLYKQLRAAGSPSDRKIALQTWVKTQNQTKGWVELPQAALALSFRERPQTQVGLGDLTLYALIDQHHVKARDLFYTDLVRKVGDPNYWMLHLAAGITHPDLRNYLITRVNQPKNRMNLIDEGARWLLTVDEQDNFTESLSQSPDKLTRVYAASQIAKIANPERRERMTKLLMNDPTAEVLGQVVEKGELSDEQRDDYLEALSKAKMPEHRAVAAKYIPRIVKAGSLQEVLNRLIDDPAPEVLVEIVKNSENIRPEDRRTRVLKRYAKHKSLAVQKAVFDQLLNHMQGSLPKSRVFLALAHSRHPGIREELAKHPELLAEESAWFEYYLSLGLEQNPTVLVNLGEHIGQVPFDDVRMTLVRFLANRPHDTVKASVIPHLGLVDNPNDVYLAWEYALSLSDKEQHAQVKQAISQVKYSIWRDCFNKTFAKKKAEAVPKQLGCLTWLARKLESLTKPKQAPPKATS